MPFIRRHPDGQIAALLDSAENDSSEFLPATSAEVRAFLGQEPDAEFSSLDSDFIRVMEDLIDVMLDKGLLRLTDLPPEAQRKLLARKDMRRRRSEGLNLLGDTDVI